MGQITVRSTREVAQGRRVLQRELRCREQGPGPMAVPRGLHEAVLGPTPKLRSRSRLGVSAGECRAGFREKVSKGRGPEVEGALCGRASGGEPRWPCRDTERELDHARPVGHVAMALFQEQGKQAEDFKRRSAMVRCAESELSGTR